MADFPAVKTLEEFNYDFAKVCSVARSKRLPDWCFVERQENVMLVSPSGVGKTHSAMALECRAPQVARADDDA